MLKIKNFLLLFLIFLFSGLALSAKPVHPITSSHSVIDSLKILLKQTELECSKPCPADTLTIDLLNQIAFELRSKYPDSSFLISQKALALSFTIGDEKGTGQSYLQIGNYFWRKGDYEKSIESFNKSIKHFLHLNDSNYLSSAYGNLGNVYRDKGDYQQAFDFFTTALKISKLINNKKNISAWSGNLGLIYSDFGDYPSALKYYFESLKLAEEDGNQYQKASFLGNIGVTYKKMNDFDNAEKYYKVALSIFKEIGDKQKTASTLNNLGSILVSKQQFSDALKFYNEALEIDYSLGNKSGIAGKLGSIGLVFEKMADKTGNDSMYYCALDYYEKAVAIAKEINSKNILGNNLGKIGNLYISLGYFHKAEKHINDALEISVSINSLEQIKEQHEIFTDMYIATKNSKKALEHFKKFILSRDSLMNEEKSKSIGKLEARYEIEVNEIKQKHEESEKDKKLNETIQRRNTLQYSGVFVFIVMLSILVLFIPKFTIPIKLGAGLIFFTFLLFFEFIIILLDPFIESFTNGEPAWKLLCNAIIALLIFPLHYFFENKLKSKLLISSSVSPNSNSKLFMISLLSFILLSVLHSCNSDEKNHLKNSDHTDTTEINRLNSIGFELRFSNPDSSLLLCKKTQEMSEEINYSTGLANSYRTMGVVYRLKGNYSKSFSYYDKAFSIFKKNNNLKGMASVQGNIGIIFDELGDRVNALKYNSEAMKIYKSSGDEKRYSIALGNMGLIYWGMFDYKNALKYYNESLTITEKINDIEFTATLLGNICFIYSDMGQNLTALDYLNRAILLDEKVGNKNGVARHLTNKALILRRLGVGNPEKKDSLLSESEKILYTSISINKELGAKGALTNDYGNLGSIYILQKKFKISERYLFEALNLSLSSGNKELSWIYRNLHDLYYEQNMYDKAFKYYKLFIQYNDSLFSEDRSKQFGKAEAKFEFDIAEVERIKTEREAQKKQQIMKDRRNNLQYSGVFILIFILFLFILSSRKLRLPLKFSQGLIFLTFLLFFEFLLVLSDPYFEKWTNSEPFYKLCINAIIASVIFPVHHIFKDIILNKIIKKVGN